MSRAALAPFVQPTKRRPGRVRREAFSMYDEGRKGWLSSHECKCAFTAVMGRKPSPIEISHLLRKCPGGR